MQGPPEPQFFDRSPICTLALAQWLGHPVSSALDQEIQRLRRDRIYSFEVFFAESLGFIEQSTSWRMSLADARRFGELHEQVYLAHGYEMIRVGPVWARRKPQQASQTTSHFSWPWPRVNATLLNI